jgi:hypothetical protein
VWRRISPSQPATGGELLSPPLMARGSGESTPPAAGGRRKRRRAKRRRAAVGDTQEQRSRSPASASSGGLGAEGAVQHVVCVETPSCVLDFSTELAREEAALRKALLVAVTGTRPEVPAVDIIEEIAQSFNVNRANMSIHRTLPEDFLVFFPDEDTVSRVLNGGKIFRGPQFDLVFKRWTRCANASTASLPVLLDVEIRGIPAHAWSRATAEQLLRDSCIIDELHLATVLKSDFSSFMLRAWCINPAKLHRNMDLLIMEKGPGSGVKRCLSYKLNILATPVPVEDGALPADDGDGAPPDGDGGHTPGGGGGHQPGGSRGLPFRPSSPRQSRGSDGGRRSALSRLGSQQPSRRVGNDLVIAPGETINGAVGEAAEVLPSVLRPSTEGAELNVGDVRVPDGMPDRQAEELLAEELLPDKDAEELFPDRHADESLGRALDGLVSPRCLSSLAGTAEDKGQCEAEELFPDRQADESLGRALDGLVSPRCLSSLAGTAEEIGQCVAAGLGCPTLKVYSIRRQRDPLQQTPSPLEDTSVEPDHVKDTTLVCDFVALVTKKTDGLLPPPVPLRRGCKQLPPDFIPRRSSRLARKRTPNDATRQIQFELLRTMDIGDADEAFSDKALEKYGRLFNSPLSESHIKALAALFGWSVPVDIHLQDVQVLPAVLGPEDIL